MRVAAVSAQGPFSPAFRVRTAIPAPALAGLGVEIRPLPLFDAADARRFSDGGWAERARVLARSRRRLRRQLRADDSTVALIQRQVDMLPSRGLDRAALAGRRTILDVDDALWLDTDRSAGGHRLAWVKRSERKLAWLAATADHVIAGNELLAEWLQTHSTDVTVVPSLIDVPAVPLRKHEQRVELVLGWIGSPSTAPFLQAMSAALETLPSELPDRVVKLEVVGGSAPRLRGVDVVERDWSEETEASLLARMDVGLMPLPDTPFTRGKCAYKALQYMAAGVPVVADDVGISARVIGDGASGLIAHSPGDWTDALTALATDSALRDRLGAEGRRRVEEGFAVRKWAPTIAAILAGAR